MPTAILRPRAGSCGAESGGGPELSMSVPEKVLSRVWKAVIEFRP